MTKEEVRTVSLSKLRLQEDSVCYDVGAGTGSVSVEMALRAWKGQVYAIEKKEDALALLKENRRKFATDNLEIVPGTAPEAMVELPVPTHAFIGGSSGNMHEILDRCEALLAPGGRIILTAVTVETTGEVVKEFADRPFELEGFEMQINRLRKLGRYHLYDPMSPIFIFTAIKH